MMRYATTRTIEQQKAEAKAIKIPKNCKKFHKKNLQQ